MYEEVFFISADTAEPKIHNERPHAGRQFNRINVDFKEREKDDERIGWREKERMRGSSAIK